MKTSTSGALNGNMCVLHDEQWLKRQRIAGKVAAQTLSLLESLVKDKTAKSLLELDQIAEEFIVSHGCSPSFKSYKGFPASVCMSVDNETSHAMVHGIPFDYRLQDGDLISFDLGATFEGSIGDTALTCIFGEPREDKHVKLIEDTKAALMKGIEAVKVGERLGVIGQAIYGYAHQKGYGVINNYGGHSLTYDTPHAFPFVSNRSSADEGVRICAGMTIAIEPMLVFGSTKTWTGKDGWTVFSEKTSSHEEHTIFIHSDRAEIMTDRSQL